MSTNIGNKTVTYGTKARTKLIDGANAIANAVKSTLGPRGHTVIIEQESGSPHVTKDGVSVANAIKFRDREMNLGARMVQDVAAKAAEHAGDGTTTATVLAQSILNEGNSLIHTVKNSNDVRKGIELAVNKTVETIKEWATPVDEENEIKHIATLSANGDEEIGSLIAEAFNKVGKDGTITVKASDDYKTELNVVEGMEFKKGYLSPYFVTDHSKMIAEYDNAKLLITDKKITTINSIIPLLQVVCDQGLALVIIADDIEDQAITNLVINRMKGGLKVLAIKAPGYGDRKLDVLRDIAAIAGCEVVSDELGTKLETTTLASLGTLKHIKSTREITTLTGMSEKSDLVQKRVDEIKALLETATREYDKERYQRRLGALTSGVAEIKVGGITEAEIKERKDRADDAVCATRSAVEEGIVPGGGVTLLRISKILKNDLKSDNYEQNLGIELVANALTAPIKQILKNSGDEVHEIMTQIVQNDDKWYGYDARNSKFCNLREAGVLDPAKVTRCAIQDASSIASLILTTDTIITIDPEDDKPQLVVNP